MPHKYTNALAQESSPYLLQHAHNPVEWLPWGEHAREKAMREQKLMLVSVGYSSCHWCHVMERECFEDEEVAHIMNRHFVNVKVDREERPDVDQVYMDAVQAMARQGGWPLNCFTTPDGMPIYGGTYFPKAQWMNLLQQLANLWHEDREQVLAYGRKMADGLAVKGGLPLLETKPEFSWDKLDECVTNWQKNWDPMYGGPNKAPKFPLPCNYTFLLHYAHLKGHTATHDHVQLTLNRMARGGIYDQVGGGFARYSTDVQWKVPHFEKMLYDNAQLLALYAEAWHAYKHKEYLEVADGIFEWLRRDMRHPSGGYYSAMDADSEGVEGLYYTWTPEELKEAGLYDAYNAIYRTDDAALWEERLIPVLHGPAKGENKDDTPHAPARPDIKALNNRLLRVRSKRIPPLTDVKCLCSWNAMLAAALAQGYTHTGREEWRSEAISIMDFIDAHLTQHSTGTLLHTWTQGKARTEVFLEDYAFAAQACLHLYTANYQEKWLAKARSLAMAAIDGYYDDAKGIFFFTPLSQNDLIARPMELSDNVIPSGNAVMAHVLDSLAAYFGIARFREIADRLLHAVTDAMADYGAGYACWANLYLKKTIGSPELVFAGPDALKYASEAQSFYLPMATRAAAADISALELLKERMDKDHTRLYTCIHHTCASPAHTVQEALANWTHLYPAQPW